MRIGPGISAATCAALLAALPVAVEASSAPARTRPDPPGGQINAYYSPGHDAPQSRSRAAMRKYLSTPQPRFDLQSFVFFGSLVDDDGSVKTFSTMTQTQRLTTPPTVGSVTVNDSDKPGTIIGGLAGEPGSSIDFTLGADPWTARVQPIPAGSPEQFVQAAVVKGRVGQRGAVYRLTGYVPGEDPATRQAVMLQTRVRVKDLTGIAQWGYGPSGFFPQWIFPAQRTRIMKRFDGSVERYLRSTGRPLTGQGDYYYSAPLLQVKGFTVSRDGETVSRGSSGYLWLDTVNQSFDNRARRIVDNGVQWLEFSVQLPGSRQALKIGRVSQPSVGTLPYAVLMRRGGDRARDGLIVPTARWNIGDIRITPVPGSRWKSPVSGQTYYLSYDVRLAGKTAGHRGRLRITALFADQEVSLPSRTVYEGLFRVKGTLRGERVTGQSWAEIQPS